MQELTFVLFVYMYNFTISQTESMNEVVMELCPNLLNDRKMLLEAAQNKHIHNNSAIP